MNALFFYDPLPEPDSPSEPLPRRRPWGKLLGESARECTWDEGAAAFRGQEGPIKAGTVVAHYSALSMNDVSTAQIETCCRDNPMLTVIVVSGGGRPELFSLPNLYYRKTPLGEAETDPFGRCFGGFLTELDHTGRRVFDLLETSGEGTDYLIALDVLCQGFLFAHGQGTPERYGVPFPVSEEMREKTARADWWTGGLEMADPAQLDGLLRGQGLPADRAGAIAGFLASALQETLPARTAAVRRLQAEVREALR